MKLLLLLLHLLPSGDQLITRIGGYWVGWIFRLASHFGLPTLWERDLKTAFLAPFRIHDRKKTILWSVLGACLAFIAITGLYLLPRSQFDPIHIRTEVAKLYPITKPVYLLVGLSISFLNPLMEEFYWRGFLYRKYAEKGGGLWIGVLFALHHYIIFHAWFAALPLWIATAGLAFVGVLFNWLYRKTGNLYACLSTHIAADISIILIGYTLLFD
jgi:membrane protease YdiL (CAAX protease family)